MAGSASRGVIPHVNSLDGKVPTEKELDFDPNGPGQVGAGLRDPVGAIFAIAAERAAREATARLYPGALARTNEANAFLHGAGSYLLARTIGRERAKAMGDAHEVDGINGVPFPVIGARKNTEGNAFRTFTTTV